MIWTRGTKIITAPASEPITTATAKEWLKVDISADDTLIDATVSAARSHIEKKTGLALFTQTIRDVLDEWPEENAVSNPYGTFYLMRYPVQSVTNIQYVDSDGTTQTLSSDVYQVDTNGMFTRIGLKADQSWPSIRNQIATITINYTAGYSLVADIPADITVALKLLMTYYYENRVDSVHRYKTAADALISTHYSPIL